MLGGVQRSMSNDGVCEKNAREGEQVPQLHHGWPQHTEPSPVLPVSCAKGLVAPRVDLLVGECEAARQLRDAGYDERHPDS